MQILPGMIFNSKYVCCNTRRKTFFCFESFYRKFLAVVLSTVCYNQFKNFYCGSKTCENAEVSFVFTSYSGEKFCFIQNFF